jgi:SAM-dependent methyltransferase
MEENAQRPTSNVQRRSGSSAPPVLDACCGARMFWFDPKDPRAIFMDIREGEYPKDFGTPATKGRKPVVVKPDVLADYAAMPFADESFSLVVLDPPHHSAARMGSGMNIIRNAYGVLLPGWEENLRRGFEECFRVLRANGVLVFKWCSREIPLQRVLALTPQKPLFGHRTVKKDTTHWVIFLKPPS